MGLRFKSPAIAGEGGGAIRRRRFGFRPGRVEKRGLEGLRFIVARGRLAIHPGRLLFPMAWAITRQISYGSAATIV